MVSESIEEQPNVVSSSNAFVTSLKIILSAVLLSSSVYTYHTAYPSTEDLHSTRRRLTSLLDGDYIPTHMKGLMEDLASRKKRFAETPPDEIKYWFEFPGPLQKYFYRYSRSRGKADYFEGRDDSGVVSARFVPVGGGEEYNDFYNTPDSNIPASELPLHYRLVENCFALGSQTRPDLSLGGNWHKWFGSGPSNKVMDRCRVLVTMNTVGAGKGSTMLWETHPPNKHASEPRPWMSEQSTAALHIERNLQELDAMCATGMIAVRLQVLVCEPIPAVWTDWMDSLMPNCGGQKAPLVQTTANANPYDEGISVQERPSPLQVVVVGSPSTADTCHNLKSGFMEKRVQDLILAPPYLNTDSSNISVDPTKKTTHPDLVSSDDYDVYIGLKWSSLITIRSLSAFLQASADMAAAAGSPQNQKGTDVEKNADGETITLSGPSSPFLIPSFVRVSYVSEENAKIAKWRMHGDFFHPAAWEVCKDSFDMVWIPDSISGNGGVNGVCYDAKSPGYSSMQRRLQGDECGQWWIYMAEEQMPLNPEVYANEVTPPIVQGGSNHIWMLTEVHRKEIVKVKTCEHDAKGDKKKLKQCGQVPQAVLPLGYMESFLINFMPNTALGKKHVIGRRPGYSNEAKQREDRELVRDRKQLKGQEDIEKALFDYTVYPAALFRKDATLKAARARDRLLTKKEDIDEDEYPPYTRKSSYYDITIKKPRPPTMGWCQALARKGLCALYSDYFRESSDKRCIEACGMSKNFSDIDYVAEN